MQKTSKKNIAIWLSISFLVVLVIAMSLIGFAASNNDVVYVSKSGNDAYDGTEEAPVATIAKALEKVTDGGKIVISGTYDTSGWIAPKKNLTFSGGTLNFGNASDIVLGTAGKSLIFENINLAFTSGKKVFANGCNLTMGSGVKIVDAQGSEVLPQNSIDLYAGTYKGTLNSDTNLVLHSGSYRMVFGGGSEDTINGNTNVWVGGITNRNGDWESHSDHATIYGGGRNSTIKGSTNVVFAEYAEANYIYGGCYTGGSIVGGTNVTMIGGTTMSLYGGSRGVAQGCGASVVMTGGELQQLFGGCESAGLTGNVDVKLLGGKVTRRVYGGCYNECHREGLSIVWSSAHTVTGNIALTLGSGVSVTFDAKDSNNDKYDDRSIYAHSRYKSNSAQEIATLNYAGYTEKVGAQDLAMSIIMGSLSVADNNHTHILAYNDNGATITETCSNCSHTATATILIENKERIYNGQAYTGAMVTYDRNWLVSRDLTIAYANNTNAGDATASITHGGATASVTYTISKAEKSKPENLSPVAETIKGKADGKITGLTTEMEYSTDGTTYTKVSDANMTFASGTYLVRFAETANYNASDAVNVTITAGRKLSVTIPSSAEQVGYTLTSTASELDWNGEATLTFALKNGYSKTDMFAVKVNGTKVDLNANDKYVLSNVEVDSTITVEGVADITPASAEITIAGNKWSSLLNQITFNMFFKNTQTVKIDASDVGSGVQEIYYYLSNAEVAAEEVKNISDWQEYNGEFNINPDNKYVVYVKVVDMAQNISYINSEGIVLDATTPAITGVENGRDCYGDLTFTVVDTYLDTVTVDGQVVTLTNGQYTIAADNQKHTVVASDKAGNVTTYEFKVYKIYTVTYMVDGNVYKVLPVNHGADATLPEIPAKEGYDKVAPYWAGSDKKVTSDITLTAVYTINKYTVKIVVDGTVVETKETEHGSDVTLPSIPTKVGYDQTTPYWDRNGNDIEKDTTITAVYTPNKYTVTYIVDGEEYATNPVNHGEKPKAIAIPTKEGYDKIAPYWDKANVTATGDMTLTAVYTINPGDYWDVTPETNAGGSKLENTIEELKQAIPFTQEELELVKNGEDAKVWLVVKDISSTVTTEEKLLILNKVPKHSVGIYFDASMFKQVATNNPEKVTKLDKHITVKMVVPDELINKDEKVVREYLIVRIHDDEVATIKTEFNAETKELTFETDRFSTYALAYKDTEKEAESTDDKNQGTTDNKDQDSIDSEQQKDTTKKESAKTGDNTVFMPFVVLMIVFAGIAMMILNGKRKDRA